jgi:hypothetical protein
MSWVYVDGNNDISNKKYPWTSFHTTHKVPLNLPK